MNDSSRPTREVVTDPGSGVNEDVGGTTARAAWVLDGATGVGEDGFTPGATDVQWYVRQFDEFLREHIDDYERGLPAVIESGIRAVAEEFAETTGGCDVDPAARPSAACAIVRWTETTLETFVLADCALLLTFADSEVRHYTDDRPYLRRLEREAERGMYRLATDRGLTTPEARDRIRPKLGHDRRKLRRSSQHYALCLEPGAAEAGYYARFDVTRIDHFRLLSDGVGRLVETFSTFSTWREAAEWIDRHGIEATIDRLRTIERSDSRCLEYPRIKVHDDATIASIEFS
jgi:hypothetical protein